jgi:hypothetical protein
VSLKTIKDMRIHRIPSEKVKQEQPSVDLSPLAHLFEKYRNKSGSLIPLLQGTQHLYGFLPISGFRSDIEGNGYRNG